jgi:L-ascorbate metabolism protein UlaG (beta-lactamase superfamily)
MRLIKYSHSCVRLEDSGRTLVIDPGIFSEAETALADAGAVLITHEHTDHLDEKAVRAAVAARPDLQIFAPAGVAATLADLGDGVHAVGGGETFEAAGYSVRTFGGQHALIHPTIPIVANVGFLIDGAVYHPGDSLVVPDAPVQTLLAPTNAPWGKASEIIDFIIAVRAPRVHQIHDVLINEIGTGLIEGLINRTTASFGITFEHLAPTAMITI